MTPIVTDCQGYLTLTYINGFSMPELIKHLKSIKIEKPVEQLFDGHLDATYIISPFPRNENADRPVGLPAIEVVDEEFFDEDAEPSQSTFEEYPFFNEDGTPAKAPQERPGRTTLLSICYLPESGDTPDDYYDVIDLMSDGKGHYHVYDNDNVGLLIDYDKVDCLISILESL